MRFPRWELRHTANPLDTRAYEGGGDGGAGQMRADEQARQAKVQQAVDAINGKFGVAPASQMAAPTRGQFTTAAKQESTIFTPDEGGGTTYTTPGTPGGFDQAGYDKAMADYTAAQTGVGGAKAAREAMYSDIAGAVRDTAMRGLDRQYANASRANTFGLARAGLLGGSADAEAGGELSTLYGEGKLKAQEAGLNAAADLRSTDEKTRQNLISLAQSGLDTGTAASLASGQMTAAADLAKSNAAGASVGRLFDDMSQAYMTNTYLRNRYPNGLPQQSQSSGYSTSVFNPSRYTGAKG